MAVTVLKVASTQVYATYTGLPESITVADLYTVCGSCDYDYQCMEILPSVRSSTSLGLSVNTPCRKEIRY